MRYNFFASQSLKCLTVLLWVSSSKSEVDPHIFFPSAQRPIEMSAKMCKRKDVHLSTVMQNAASGDISRVFDNFLEDKKQVGLNCQIITDGAAVSEVWENAAMEREPDF